MPGQEPKKGGQRKRSRGHIARRGESNHDGRLEPHRPEDKGLVQEEANDDLIPPCVKSHILSCTIYLQFIILCYFVLFSFIGTK
jgi:hypothetical protein